MRALLRNRAERLRDGYRYSFLLSSALIHCCDRNACASACCPAHSFEINACYIFLLLHTHLSGERDVGGREATKLCSREVNTPGTPGDGVWPRPSVCVMAIGARFYCPVHSFVVIEMRALSPAHSSL